MSGSGESDLGPVATVGKRSRHGAATAGCLYNTAWRSLRARRASSSGVSFFMDLWNPKIWFDSRFRA